MSILDNVIKGKVSKPPKLMVWGPPAVGKSTFAAQAPGALFIESEDRTGHLDLSRLPVRSWEDTMTALKELATAEECPYKTVVFDTVDALELLLFKFIADAAGVESHEDIGGGFAKYRTPMLRQWKRFMNAVDLLTKRGIQCILLAHAKQKVYQPPSGQAYERFVIKMDQAGGDFLIENVDLVGYAKFQTFVSKQNKNDRKAQATTTGKRLLQFKYDPVYPTKQGVPCADQVDLTWVDFQRGLETE